MTIMEAVNANKGKKVRVQVLRDGYTQFISDNETANFLLLGRTKNTTVDHISIDDDGAVHIYRLNYLDYKF